MTISTPSTILRIIIAAALVTTSALAHSAAPGSNAQEIITHVERQAAAEHKSILLTFGASWCVNCHLFDKFLADPTIHPIMDKSFVYADLDTGEKAGDKGHTNIPGGEKLQTSLGGKDAGYPYIVMLDASGNLIADSKQPGAGGNIGYPDAPNEIEWFMEMVKKAAPSLSAQDTATIRNWLTAHSHSSKR
jgi:thioredoxin-related protein